MTTNERMPSRSELRPLEVAVLAIARAAAATGAQIGDLFPEHERGELKAVLDNLCRQRLLVRDAAGAFWATGFARHVLAANSEANCVGDQ